MGSLRIPKNSDVSSARRISLLHQAPAAVLQQWSRTKRNVHWGLRLSEAHISFPSQSSLLPQQTHLQDWELVHQEEFRLHLLLELESRDLLGEAHQLDWPALLLVLAVLHQASQVASLAHLRLAEEHHHQDFLQEALLLLQEDSGKLFMKGGTGYEEIGQ